MFTASCFIVNAPCVNKSRGGCKSQASVIVATDLQYDPSMFSTSCFYVVHAQATTLVVVNPSKFVASIVAGYRKLPLHCIMSYVVVEGYGETYFCKSF
jgi:hypothetical protein